MLKKSSLFVRARRLVAAALIATTLVSVPTQGTADACSVGLWPMAWGLGGLMEFQTLQFTGVINLDGEWFYYYVNCGNLGTVYVD